MQSSEIWIETMDGFVSVKARDPRSARIFTLMRIAENLVSPGDFIGVQFDADAKKEKF